MIRKSCCKKWSVPAFAGVLAAAFALPALADPQLLERARKLLSQNNPKQAFVELAAAQDKYSGTLEFDYLLGVAALDSGRFDESIIAFERVLALNPNHAGAQMDLGRAYFALGSYDLAEAAFRRLKASNPPTQALVAINQYLEAIETRRRETTPGWSGFAELSLGYDDNISGVPTDFGSASQQSIGLRVDSAIYRAAYFEGLANLEYSHPISRGWSLFIGGGARGRAYDNVRPDPPTGGSAFNVLAGDVRAGAALNDGPTQWRVSAGYQEFNQEGAATGEPQPTNDRRTANATVDWRRMIDSRNQLGLGLQVNRIRFPENAIEDFDQLYLGASWLRSYQGAGAPLLYVTGFVTEDRAKNTLADGTTDKSKNLAGIRGYYQVSFTPKLQGFNSLGFIYRQDKDAYARSTLVETGKDQYGEVVLGLTWSFRERCAVRAQWAYTQNNSNIDIYDFKRNEVSTAVRCDLF